MYNTRVGAERVSNVVGPTPPHACDLTTWPFHLFRHSLSKYLCGHGDAIGGAVIGKKADRLQVWQHAVGGPVLCLSLSHA